MSDKKFEEVGSVPQVLSAYGVLEAIGKAFGQDVVLYVGTATFPATAALEQPIQIMIDPEIGPHAWYIQACGRRIGSDPE